MPEWSIGPHSKCGVRATVPGVRIPLFPQKNEARRCRRISTSFCFVALRHANLFVGRSGMKTKVVDLSTPCGVRILQGAPRRAKGKTSRHEVATKSIPLFPQKNEARRCRRISTSFCFVTLRHANLFVRRSGMKTKVVDLSTPCGVRILQGAPRRAKGKTSRHEVATKSIPLFPQKR